MRTLSPWMLEIGSWSAVAVAVHLGSCRPDAPPAVPPAVPPARPAAEAPRPTRPAARTPEAASLTPTPRPVVGPGVYRPQFPVSPEEAAIEVPAFRLDTTPVTQAAFLNFVLENPEWRRGSVRPLFADARYLSGWRGPTTLGADVEPNAPITEISWFAAEAYCEANGATLPTISQWELAAAADPTRVDASDDPQFIQTILDWYARPNPSRLPEVGRGQPNVWGIHDLHGLVWEWTLDFNADLVATDARDQNDPDRLQFCGTGALGADDSADYASFMRVAMRTSLRAHYSTPNLGFRCAQALDSDRLIKRLIQDQP